MTSPLRRKIQTQNKTLHSPSLLEHFIDITNRRLPIRAQLVPHGVLRLSSPERRFGYRLPQVVSGVVHKTCSLEQVGYRPPQDGGVIGRNTVATEVIPICTSVDGV